MAIFSCPKMLSWHMSRKLVFKCTVERNKIWELTSRFQYSLLSWLFPSYTKKIATLWPSFPAPKRFRDICGVGTDPIPWDWSSLVLFSCTWKHQWRASKIINVNGTRDQKDEKNRENLLILELTTALLILVCCSLRKLGVASSQHNTFIQVLLNVVDSAEVMTDQWQI